MTEVLLTYMAANIWFQSLCGLWLVISDICEIKNQLIKAKLYIYPMKWLRFVFSSHLIIFNINQYLINCMNDQQINRKCFCLQVVTGTSLSFYVTS